jgi:hypothetical protein
MKEFCGEIVYEDELGGVHSDICHHNDLPLTYDYRKLLHECLDEWLDKSNGTGVFWVGNPGFMEREPQ